MRVDLEGSERRILDLERYVLEFEFNVCWMDGLDLLFDLLGVLGPLGLHFRHKQGQTLEVFIRCTSRPGLL